MEDQIIQWIIQEAAGTLSEADQQALSRWRQASASNEACYQDYRLVWQSADAPSLDPPNTEEAWSRLSGQINKVRPVRQLRRWWVAAAVIMIALGASVWAWHLTWSNPIHQEIVAATSLQVETLSDGTQVFLRPGSSLQSTMTSDQRMITLQGEAFFQVTPDADRPFLVVADALQVKVLGTSFLVRHPDHPQGPEVAVAEGHVAVQHLLQQESFELRAGDRVSWRNVNGDGIQETDISGNSWAWQSGILRFQSTPLSAVLDDLENTFGVTIHLQSAHLSDCRFTSRFEDAELHEILAAMSDVFACHIESPAEGIYYLNGGTCR